MWLLRSMFIILLVSGMLGGLAAQTSPSTLADSNLEPVLKILRPALNASGKTGRINFLATCPLPEGGFEAVLFPQISVQSPSPGKMGLVAVRQIFQNEKNIVTTEGHMGIIRIRIGKVPDAILQTKISLLNLAPMFQYNASLVFSTISTNPDVKTAMRKLGVRPAVLFGIHSLAPTISSLPHLPSTTRNITVDQLLDRIARTFKGIVL